MMPLLTGLINKVFASSLLVCVFAATLQRKAECPVTLVEQYLDGECNSKGWVRTPSYLKRLTQVASRPQCAGICLEDDECKSFRYRYDQGKCDLYREYLDGMSFTADNFEIGTFSNRDCYSTNCDVIRACKQVERCPEYPRNDYDDQWTRYACGFGETTNLDKYHRKRTRIHYLNGTLTSCQAIRACGAQAENGPFDVFLHPPSEQWVCIDRDFFGYLGADSVFLYPEDQHVNRRTLSVRNASVAESYGFYFSSYYHE